ncbi:MAG: glycoside hydrolase family 3 protein [Treponema sp.]|jgi:beta-N-acetylhexosaminidase|nr:glycoside hydrolase family 3 protein [Treponema sp.]
MRVLIKTVKRGLSLRLIALILIALFSLSQGHALDFTDPLPPDELAGSIVSAMSDEEALAQTFMLGWIGTEPSPLILEWVRERRVGGVKVFGWNTGDTLVLAKSIGDMQNTALDDRAGKAGGGFHIPLLVATDQEGGWIRHIKGLTSETPGNMAIGASGRPADAYWSGYYIGRELKALGINMNFAPDVDVYTNRDSVIIGPRSFGADPTMVAVLGTAFVKGQSAAGIIATAKHYPGHGDTQLDSHGILPRIDVPFETLWERELLPYRFLVQNGLPAVMSGHLAFPKTQAGEGAASLSPWFLGEVLRERIGFDGVVITDDLMMIGALSGMGSLAQAAKQALMAGNDILMFSSTPLLNASVWTTLLTAMKNEAAFQARVRDAAQRVLALKLRYMRGENAVPVVPDIARVKEQVPDTEGGAFFLDLAARSVTLVKGDLPLSPTSAGQVLLVGEYGEFLRAGRRAYPNALSCRYNGLSGSLIRASDTIIFCLADAEGLPYLGSLRASGKRVIVFSVLSPVYLDAVPWVDGAIAVYSYAPVSFTAGFSALLGRIPAEGRLPFPLDAPRWTVP